MDINQELGICVKDINKNVLSQNELCISTCGNLINTVCEKGCMENYTCHSHSNFDEGMSLIKNVYVDGNYSDAVVIKNNNLLITIFYPLINKYKKIDKEISDLKKYGLTNSEMDILSMSLKGIQNNTIARKLYIAKSTLKTHLNNIYKKLPSNMQFIKNRK
jgi:DNA-binding NarL/FixJ family response regulator